MYSLLKKNVLFAMAHCQICHAYIRKHTRLSPPSRFQCSHHGVLVGMKLCHLDDNITGYGKALYCNQALYPHIRGWSLPMRLPGHCTQTSIPVCTRYARTTFQILPFFNLRWDASHSAEVNENINLGYSQDQGYS